MKKLLHHMIKLEINPKDADAWNHKGLVLDKVGRQDEVQNCFDKAKELGLNI
jgi:Flp pilus assembly protein TadD